MKRGAFLLLAGLLCALPTLAKPAKDEQTLLGTYGNWRAYTFEENGSAACYMALSAAPAKTPALKRGAIRLTVTHRPSEGSKDVVSYAPGYNFKPTSTVEIRVGMRDFQLFTAGDTAWARDTASDHALAAAIRDGTRLIATGAPVPKTKPKTPAHVTDALDLTGAAKAYRAIGSACGIEAPSAKKKTATPPKH
jgi:hypothetical protein